MNHRDSTIDVIRRAKEGSPTDFADLVKRFQGMAFGYAYTLLRDSHLAQDATQEAFLEVYRSLDTLRSPEAFPSWFRRIVLKHCDRLTRRLEL